MANHLSLTQSNQIINAALAKGAELNTPPLTIAILDDGGHLKAFQRQDSASPMRPDIAIAKAWGAIGMGMSSRVMGNMGAERPAFVSALTSLAHGKLVPVPGGVLVRDDDNDIIGAVGITGDTSDVGETCAIAGIQAAALIADAG